MYMKNATKGMNDMKSELKSLLSSVLIVVLVLVMILPQGCASNNGATDDDGDGDGDGDETVAATTKKKIVYPDTIDFDDQDTIIEIFDVSDVLDGVTTTVNKKGKTIIQKGTVGDVSFTFTIGLSKWGGYTTPQQMTVCSKLFWYCYPQMYARLANGGSPKAVMLNFEDEGYEVASTSDNVVHIHDRWLYNNKSDYDCLTHEFAHVIQGGWMGSMSPAYNGDTYMIERFADYCRYVYAFDSGLYNDTGWDLQTSKTENTYYKSVRFWVWIDYTYSTESADIINRINKYVYEGGRSAASNNWVSGGPMWDKVFKNTDAYGKSLDELWELFTSSDFSTLSTKPTRAGKASKLESEYSVRETIKVRAGGADDYIKL